MDGMPLLLMLRLFLGGYDMGTTNYIFPQDTHIKRFTGNIWYVDGSVSASGEGDYPENAFKTIGEDITAASAGDAITIKAGTYTELSLDMNKNALEFWFEIGVIIDPASGTAFYVRIVMGTALASGAMHVHCKYIPITDDGFLEVA